jgi:transposase
MPVRDEKLAALRAAHALNPAPETVRDEAFTSGDPFFDARDLVQVKYEMLRRVSREGHSVTSAAAAFGFSRPSFYAAQAAWQAGGLPALLPARPGPRRGHKLTPEVVAFLRDYQTQHPTVRSAQLVEVLYDRFGLRVHRRSIERALTPKSKNP